MEHGVLDRGSRAKGLVNCGDFGNISRLNSGLASTIYTELLMGISYST